nr:raftlin-2 [Paramormyrops kingsleyae]
MGCGLSKLEDREDSSPGKIYSTLKRPQVETKCDVVHEYVLLDFSLEGSRATVQGLASLCELPKALEPYYTEGYTLAALHPVVLSVRRSGALPCSLQYRAILTRPRTSKDMVPMCQRAPVLRVEEWPLPGDSLTADVIQALIDRVDRCARGGLRFVGSLLQQAGGWSLGCNGRSCVSPAQSPSEGPGLEESRSTSPDLNLLVLFHSWDSCCVPLDPVTYCYHQGALSMRVSRKGHVISSLEADWLELTATYYQRGWSLVDSFVYWDTPKGEPVPRSLEGLFLYEECSATAPPSDTIVVEQWTVIEGSGVKSDYGPLLHTLADFGWLLTCVLPTPIIRHDSEGNLATKQVLFLQRPVTPDPVQQQSQRGSNPRMVSSCSANLGLAFPPQKLPSCTGETEQFSVYEEGYCSSLSQLGDGCLEQDDAAAEVTSSALVIQNNGHCL